MEKEGQKQENRKLNRLSLDQKLLVIEDHKTQGMSMKDLAKKYDVSLKTIQRIILSQDNIRNKIENVKKISGDVSKLKKYTPVYDSPFEKSLYAWFLQKRNLNQPVSTSLLQARAKMMHTHFYGETDFAASDGWMHKFKKRHGLRSVGMKGEKISADHESAEHFCKALNYIIAEHGYDLDNIYNADETALFWKMLPNRTFTAKFETEVHGMKSQKDRVTLQVAANATGTHKVPLTMIGKAALPRCFKQVGLENLPLIYKSHGKGWMSRKVFTDWYITVFLPSLKMNNPDPNAKFLLLVDNAPSHPSSEELNLIDSQCAVMYLPPNVTSIIQPMDQGVISALKRRYKMFFLNELDAADLQTTMGLVEFIEKWSLLECSDILVSAWDLVSQSTLRNAWNKLLRPHSTTQNVEAIPFVTVPNIVSRLPGCSQKMTMKEAEAWIDADNDFFPWEPYSDDVIYKMSLQQPFEYNDDAEENMMDEDESIIEEDSIPTTTVLKCVSQLQQWARNDPDADRSICSTLNFIKNKLVHLRSTTT